VQLKESCAELLYLGKSMNIPIFLIGHVTKGGVLAGPKVLEHMVDTVLYFEGEKEHTYRILRAVKNRFGSTNEVGIFEMKENGLTEVKNPSRILLEERALNEVRKRFGMLFQGAALFDSLTVEENVAFGLRRHTNLSREETRRIVNEKLGLVGLARNGFLKPAELSGGMKKRVGLARAIAMDPEIVLYDEPTTGVDPIMGDAINGLIIELHDKLKITSIAVTHDMASAYKIADKMAMLYDGKIIEVGTPEEIKNTENPIVRQFITGAAIGPVTAD